MWLHCHSCCACHWHNNDWHHPGLSLKWLKPVANGVGNDLQTIGKKIAGNLLRLLGAIVSFVFHTASQVFTFLGKNAWLLTASVPVLLIDWITKPCD